MRETLQSLVILVVYRKHSSLNLPHNTSYALPKPPANTQQYPAFAQPLQTFRSPPVLPYLSYLYT